MKRLLCVLLIAIIAVIGIVPAASTQAAPNLPAGSQIAQIGQQFEGIPGFVVASRLKVRRAPRVNSSIIGGLRANDKIIVLAKNGVLGTWVLVKGPSGQIGWVDRQWIRFAGTLRDLPAAITFPPYLQVTAHPSVNVRLGPGEKYPILLELPKGLDVDVLATFKNGQWYKIAFPDEGPIGWVRSDTVIVEGFTGNLPNLAREPVLGTVQAYRVRVHNAPKREAPIIGLTRYKNTYEIVGRDNRGNWWQIETAFGTGYIVAAFVTTYGDIETLPVFLADPIGPGVKPADGATS
jgi:uncharacterized protein YgiM (DUF1202 family)